MEKKKPYIGPSPFDPEIIKATQEYKEINGQAQKDSEKDLEEINAIILEDEKYISELEEEIFNLKNKQDEHYSEEGNIRWVNLLAELKVAETEHTESLAIKKRLTEMLAETLLTDTELSNQLKEMEEQIKEFKEKLLRRPKGGDN